MCGTEPWEYAGRSHVSVFTSVYVPVNVYASLASRSTQVPRGQENKTVIYGKRIQGSGLFPTQTPDEQSTRLSVKVCKSKVCEPSGSGAGETCGPQNRVYSSRGNG